MKKILNQRLDYLKIIGALGVMLLEYGLSTIWDIGFWAFAISVFLLVIIISGAELLNRKRTEKCVKKNLLEFVAEAEEILRDYNEPLLEHKGIHRKNDKKDKTVVDVFRLNYYTNKLRQLAYLSDDRTLNTLAKSDMLWNKIKDTYAGKEKELDSIILQSAKLTWLLELINRNKENDDYIFPLRYSFEQKDEELNAEDLVGRLRNGQITVFFADGGYGKTWTVEGMARIYAERYVNSWGTKNKRNDKLEFPVFIKVGDIRNCSDTPICNAMKKQLCSTFSLQKLKEENIVYEISNSDIVFVDALDEARDFKIIDSIIEELDLCQNTVVFTTRPTGINRLKKITRATSDNPMIEYKIADVTKIQVENYLKKELARKEKGEELTNEEIENVLLKFESSGFAEKCKSPFLLYCFVNTVRDTKGESNKVFEVEDEKNLKKLYGAFIVSIINRELNGNKSLNGLGSAHEVVQYLNKFAIAAQKNDDLALSGEEASQLAKEYFKEAGFDGRDLENSEKRINISLKEMHIFTIENGKYKFISPDFMYAVIDEEQVDNILMSMSLERIFDNKTSRFVKLKLDQYLSGEELENISFFLEKTFGTEVADERAFVLLGESMSTVNLTYLQDNANKLYIYGLIKWIYLFESNRKSLHRAYENAYVQMRKYFTSLMIGKTKKIQFSGRDLEREYNEFSAMLSQFARVSELKRQLFSLDNIKYIIDSYGENDYPKLLWLKERSANYCYSLDMYKRGDKKYLYPTNLEKTCKLIIEKIDKGFEFYGHVLDIKSTIDQLAHENLSEK